MPLVTSITIHSPVCVKDNFHNEWKILVGSKTYTQSNSVWLDSKKQPSIPIQSDTEYLTYKGAIQHPYWIYAYNDKEHHVYPTSDVQAIPPKIDHTQYKCMPVTVVGGKLVELGYDTPLLHTAFSKYEGDWEDNIQYAVEALQAPEPDAAIKLLGMISDISEECHCASWLVGNEHALLEIITNSNIVRTTKYGIGKVTATQILELQRLRQVCDGWWYWDIDDELRFIR